jgi:hypothetical protein
MIEQWFLQEVQSQLNKRNRVVIVDPKGACSFLLPHIEQAGIRLYKTDPAIVKTHEVLTEELFLRANLERSHPNTPVVVYAQREMDKLSFLFDYCYTHGAVNLSNPADWISRKLFHYTNIQVNLSADSLLTAAKIGVGKDFNWWKKLLHGLEPLINLEAELVPFMHAPRAYMAGKDESVKRLLEEKFFSLLGVPYIAKSPESLAQDIATHLFNGLVNNDLSPMLLQVYYTWCDSTQYVGSLIRYRDSFPIAADANPWQAHPDHCFPQLDAIALKQLSGMLNDKSLIQQKLPKIKRRPADRRVASLVPDWWKDVLVLLEYDSQPLTRVQRWEDFIPFYTTVFQRVDRAIRNLYQEFLNNEAILRPFQEYYESRNHEVLHKWFELKDGYASNQQGFLVELLKQAKQFTAVIVGDGVRYEIADQVARTLEAEFAIQKNVMFADMPSETEHNMSALYVGNNEIVTEAAERNNRLFTAVNKSIVFAKLEDVNFGLECDYLVLTYADIDKAGETLQQGAIKLFREFESVLADKIKLLFRIGFKVVHLITDHGFVLTGLLDDADKIDPAVTGASKVSERFIRTIQKQKNDEWIAFPVPYKEFQYVYAAKSHRPFKSKGAYGYAHGGFTPQEIIIPHFVFTKNGQAPAGLNVKIDNKPDLKAVPINTFAVKIAAVPPTNDLFGAATRRVQIICLHQNKVIHEGAVVTLEAGGKTTLEFDFQGYSELDIAVVDADTKDQLDHAKAIKTVTRDLGGLM